MNIKPMAPKLSIYIKTHKENEPIRPVINNTLIEFVSGHVGVTKRNVT
jgi:hypothetical protein